MVQLNPLKWGSKRRKKSQDKMRIGEIDASLKKNRRSQGGAGQKRRNLKKERAELDGSAEAARKKKEERAAKIEGARETSRKRNERRGSGVKNVKNRPTYTSKSTSTDKAAWIKKTRNSPAAKSGAFTADERWAIYQKSQKKKIQVLIGYRSKRWVH